MAKPLSSAVKLDTGLDQLETAIAGCVYRSVSSHSIRQ